jgi:hypothetical protein
MTAPLDVAGLLKRLHASQIEYVLVGGLAVNAHGVIRSTKDIDICPSPDRANLARLADMLGELDVRQVGVGQGEFDEGELPYDATRDDDLAAGGYFRLETSLGPLDIMQWLPGIDADAAYPVLSSHARRAQAFGIQIQVCSLAHLRTMKRIAGRPQDLQDLADLAAAHPDHA